jgi:hypothetical protein
LLEDLLSERALRQPSIHGDDTLAEVTSGKQRTHGTALVALGGDGALLEHAGIVVANETDEVRAGAMHPGSAHRLAVNRQAEQSRQTRWGERSLRPGSRRRRRGGGRGGGGSRESLSEGGQALFEGSAVDGAQGAADGGLGGKGGPLEVEAGSEFIGAEESPVGNRMRSALLAEEGEADDGPDDGPGMALAARFAAVRELGEDGGECGRLGLVHRWVLLVWSRRSILTDGLRL